MCDDGIKRKDEFHKTASSKYNGYNFKETIIFNPWAVINALSMRRCESFWVDSGLSINLRNVFRIDVIKHKLENLLSEGGTSRFVYNKTTTYYELLELKKIGSFESYGSTDINIFFTFLFECGYLSPIANEDEILEVKLPNEEIKEQIYRKLNSNIISQGILDLDYIRLCAELFDDIFLKLASDSSCQECLTKIKDYLEKIFTSLSSEKLNESYIHSILLIIAWETSEKFMSKTKCGIECNAYELDTAIYNDTCCIIIEAKHDKSATIAIQQIFNREYFTIFQCNKYFPEGVKNFILLGINIDKEKKVSMNAVFSFIDRTTVPKKMCVH